MSLENLYYFGLLAMTVIALWILLRNSNIKNIMYMHLII